MSNTIIALSTPIGRSAIAVVRMSGDDCIDIAKKIFTPFPRHANFLQVGKLTTAHFTEQAMCVFFAMPKSFTGENMVEFHCHGGVAVCSAVIEKCISLGARLAKNGEFSKIAFLNGKQNLSNAEGIIEMIDAETAVAAKAGSNLLENKLGKKILELQDSLLDIISQAEAVLDYPEEDIEVPTAVETSQQVEGLLVEIQQLLSTVSAGKTVKYGIDIAIVGQPNVGKSSLLNALLDSDRAIVSETAGTTRDTLTESVIFNDVKFNFVDTAGIHKTQNDIEAEGIRRAKKAAENADLVLFVVDKLDDKTSFETEKKQLKLFNKCDTFSTQQPSVLRENEMLISAKTGKNIELLKQRIFDMFCGNEILSSDIILTNARHVDCLTNAKNLLNEALVDLKTSTLDCVALKLRAAWQVLGEITGSTATEEIVDRIFSRFCLGK